MRFKSCVFAAGLATLVLATLPLAAQQAPPAEGTEAELIAVLQSDAPLFNKAKACQQLAVIGTAEAVPTLAGLLSDNQLAHYARYALEPIPAPAVDEALRAALDNLDGVLLIGVINSIGHRGDGEAVGQLQAKLSHAQADVASSAAAALGRIATPEAVAALRAAMGRPEPLRAIATGASLTAADEMLAAGKADDAAKLYDALREADLPKHLHTAALAGAIRARGNDGIPLLVECLKAEDRDVFRVGLQMAHEIGGPDVARAVMQQIELPETVESAEQGTVIQRAEYGADNRWVDVTQQVAAAAARGESVQASNDLAGDPAPRTPKVLRIVYVRDGQQHTAEIPEGQSITLDAVAAATPHPRQVLLIATLGDLGERVALPVVLEAAQSGAADVQQAAIGALGTLADASAVPVLLEVAATVPAAAQAARQSLIDLRGDDVDAAIAQAFSDAEGQELLLLIELAGERNIAAVVPALKDAADSDDPQVATAAIGALGATIGPADLPSLIERLIDPDSPEIGRAAKSALQVAVLRMPDPDAAADRLLAAMPKASEAVQVDLIELLAEVGSDRALAGVANAAKTGSDAIQNAATRVLGEWMSPDVAPVLLDLARTGPEAYRIRCLRGYIRVFRQLGLPDEQKLDMAGKALKAAQRNQERELVLDALTRIPDPKALEMVMAHLGDAALREAASKAAVSIAERLAATHPAVVVEAMPKVIAARPDADTAAAARRWLNEAQKRVN